MVAETTQEITVLAENEYQPRQSLPEQGLFMFAYLIRIENHSDRAVKLLRRHWYITDAFARQRQVEGEGVLGLQPELGPGEAHEYVSACNLSTDIGKMRGTYLMQYLDTEEKFEVRIPEFVMVHPCRLN